MHRRTFLAGLTAGFASAADQAPSRGQVSIARVPHGGIQPQVAVEATGAVHLVYFQGEPGAGDLYYARSADGQSFSPPIRVNSQAGSAVATGTIRGAQLGLGKQGRVHVAWNGSRLARPRGPLNPEMPAENPHNGLPMLYARMNDGGEGFEPQRNLMQVTHALDGGGSVTADAGGNVFVAWHGREENAAKGEAGRRVYIAASRDEGRTFAAERAADPGETGACACCGLRIFAGSNGAVYALYRSATEVVHRDIYLLSSTDGGVTFGSRRLDPWEIGACPMSSMSFAEAGGKIFAAWETAEQVRFARIDAPSEAVTPPGEARRREHPWLAANGKGEVLLVWTEGTGWQRGGSLAWRLFDSRGKATEEHGIRDGAPAWSFAAAFPRKGGGFQVLY